MTRWTGGRGRRTPIESVVMGLAMMGALVAWWALAPSARSHMWLLPCALFAGLMPAARGLAGILSERARLSREREAQGLPDPRKKRAKGGRLDAASIERSILRVASERGGRVTPSLVALDSGMSIEEAERHLDALASKGHASLGVRSDGRVEYEFSEFLPRTDVPS